MAEGRAKIIIDADAAKVIAEAIKAGDAISKTARKTKSIGDEFTRAITKVELFKKAVSLAGQAVSAVVDRAERLSKQGGGGKLSLATSLSSLGVPDIDAAVSRVRASPGGATLDEIESFAASLAEQQRSGRVGLGGGDAIKAIEQYAAGGSLAFGQGGRDLLEGLGRGLPLNEAVNASVSRRPGLFGLTTNTGSAILEELGLRQQERYGALDEENRGRAAGRQVRAGRIELNRQLAEGGVGASLLGILPQAVQDAGSAYRGRAELAGVREAIGEQTELIRQQTSKPTLAPGADQ